MFCVSHRLRTEYITVEPRVVKTSLVPSRDPLLILACDGLWDVCTDQDAVDMCLAMQGQPAQAMSDMLLKYALENGTTDNVSVMVVTLDDRWDGQWDVGQVKSGKSVASYTKVATELK